MWAYTQHLRIFTETMWKSWFTYSLFPVILQSISCHFTVYFLSFYSLFPVILQSISCHFTVYFPVILQSISCHYASAEIEFIDVKGSIQEHMEKETRDMARKKILARGLNPESLTLKVRRT